MNTGTDCLFCKIVRAEIPCRKVFEDDDLLAFHDIAPWAPVHFLIIPKLHLNSLYDAGREHQTLLGKMTFMAPILARQEGAVDGFRCIINTGADGGQEVAHLHLHVIGGPRPWRRG